MTPWFRSGVTSRAPRAAGCGLCVAGAVGVLVSMSSWTGAASASSTPARGPSSSLAEIASVVLSPQDTYLKIDAANHSTESVLATYTWPDRQAANVEQTT